MYSLLAFLGLLVIPVDSLVMCDSVIWDYIL